MVAALDQALWVTIFPDVAATTRHSEFMSLRQLHPRLVDTVADTKAELPLVKLCSFGQKRTTKNSLRHDRNINEVYGAEADYDREQATPEQIADALRQHSLAGVVVTSPSHRDDAPRARVLLPFSRPLKPDQRAKMVSRVAGILPDEIAAESWTLSQAYYIGRVGDARAHRVIEVEGDFVDLRDDLDATAKPRPAPVSKPRRQTRTNGTGARASNGATAPGVSLGELGLLPVDPEAALDAIARGEGSHDAMVRLAGRWAAHGMPRDDIIAALTSAMHRRPVRERDAGWDAALADLPRLVDWVIEREAAAPAPSPSPPTPSIPCAAPAPEPDRPSADLDLDASPVPAYSDEALALAFAETHADQLRYVAAWAQWLSWTGAQWRTDDTLRIFSRARLLLRQAAASCKKRRLAPAIASAKTVAAVERLVRSDRRLAATVSQWDLDPTLLNTPAGVVDLRTGEMRPHRAQDYLTKITAVAPGGDCPTWIEFLNRITGGDAALQAYLQRVAGYCLTGSTREHVLFFGYGTGANGKGTFLNTLAGVLDGYATVAAMETFTHSLTDQHPCDLAMLRGARLVTAQETSDGRRWAESRIKAMTGGDPISARFMRQDFFTYMPAFKLFIAGNHRPGLRGVNEAMRRRLQLVPFAVTIPPAERDRGLPQKLRAEWGGILAWAIEGCLQWQRVGLSPPAAVVAATDEYFGDEDVVQAWIDECCQIDRNKATYSAALYGSFCAWSERRGEHIHPQRWLTTALADRGHRQRRDKRHTSHRDEQFIVGIALRSGLGTVPP